MGVSFEDRKVLQLNKSWTPMKTVPLKDALGMVCAERAYFVDTDDYRALTWERWAELKPVGEERIRGASRDYRMPKVMVLAEYDKLPSPSKTFNRKALFRRDNYRCGYCNEQPGLGQLSIDHVIPRSQGGITCWTNVVTCCRECNFYKANRTPEQAGLVLRLVPDKPRRDQIGWDEGRDDVWGKFLNEGA